MRVLRSAACRTGGCTPRGVGRLLRVLASLAGCVARGVAVEVTGSAHRAADVATERVAEATTEASAQPAAQVAASHTTDQAAREAVCTADKAHRGHHAHNDPLGFHDCLSLSVSRPIRDLQEVLRAARADSSIHWKQSPDLTYFCEAWALANCTVGASSLPTNP